MVEYLKWLEDWMKFTESSFSDIAYKAWPIPGKANYSGGSIPLIGHYIFIKGRSHSWSIAADCKSALV